MYVTKVWFLILVLLHLVQTKEPNKVAGAVLVTASPSKTVEQSGAVATTPLQYVDDPVIQIYRYFEMIRWNKKPISGDNTLQFPTLLSSYIIEKQLTRYNSEIIALLNQIRKYIDTQTKEMDITNAKWTSFQFYTAVSRSAADKDHDIRCMKDEKFRNLKFAPIEGTDKELVAFIKNKKNSKEPSYKMITKYISVKNGKTVGKLKKALKKLKFSDFDKILVDVRKYEEDLNTADLDCTKLYSSMSNSYKFYKLVLTVMECPGSSSSLLFKDLFVKPTSLKEAADVILLTLQNVGVFEDIYGVTVRNVADESYKVLNNHRATVYSMSVFGLPLIRDIIEGVYIKQLTRYYTSTKGGRVNKGCEDVKAREEFIAAVEYVRKVLNINPTELNKECPLISKTVLSNTALKEIETELGNDKLGIDLVEDYREIIGRLTEDQMLGQANLATLFEINSTTHKYMLWKVYLGFDIDMLHMKHGLKWMLSHIHIFTDCRERFQSLKVLFMMEKYAQTVYLNKLSIVERCGLIPYNDPLDSFVIAEKETAIISYRMMRDYDITVTSDLMIDMSAESKNWNVREKQMFMMYSEIRKALEQSSIQHFEGMQKESMMNIEVTLLQRLLGIIGDCRSCDFIKQNFWGSETMKYQYVNYYDDRVGPYSYELDLWDSKKESLLEGQPDDGCKKNDTFKIEHMKTLAMKVFDSFAMRSPNAFRLYNDYIGAVGTRKQVIEMIPILDNALYDFGIFRRVMKVGLEEKDDRSMYHDFDLFDKKYAGKKSAKAFKQVYREFKIARQCMLISRGILPSDRNYLSSSGNCKPAKKKKKRKGKRKKKKKNKS